MSGEQTRVPHRRRLILGGLLLGLIALLLFFPLRVAVGWLGLDTAGLSAKAARGSIWSGQLVDANLGPVSLGTLDTHLRPLPLLVGRSELAFSGKGSAAGPLSGVAIAGSGGRGVRELTGVLPAGNSFAPLPVQQLQFTGVSAAFDGAGRCISANGRVRVDVGARLGGLNLTQGLSGDARCEGGKLLLPLASQSGMERLMLTVGGDGRYQAKLSIAGTSDPLLGVALQALGFSAVAGGYQRSVDGRF